MAIFTLISNCNIGSSCITLAIATSVALSNCSGVSYDAKLFGNAFFIIAVASAVGANSYLSVIRLYCFLTRVGLGTILSAKYFLSVTVLSFKKSKSPVPEIASKYIFL